VRAQRGRARIRIPSALVLARNGGACPTIRPGAANLQSGRHRHLRSLSHADVCIMLVSGAGSLTRIKGPPPCSRFVFWWPFSRRPTPRNKSRCQIAIFRQAPAGATMSQSCALTPASTTPARVRQLAHHAVSGVT